MQDLKESVYQSRENISNLLERRACEYTYKLIGVMISLVVDYVMVMRLRLISLSMCCQVL